MHSQYNRSGEEVNGTSEKISGFQTTSRNHFLHGVTTEKQQNKLHREAPILKAHAAVKRDNEAEDKTEAMAEGNNQRGGHSRNEGQPRGSQSEPRQNNFRTPRGRGGPREPTSANGGDRRLNFEELEKEVSKQLFPSGHDDRFERPFRGGRGRGNDNYSRQNDDRRGNQNEDRRGQENRRDDRRDDRRGDDRRGDDRRGYQNDDRRSQSSGADSARFRGNDGRGPSTPQRNNQPRDDRTPNRNNNNGRNTPGQRGTPNRNGNNGGQRKGGKKQRDRHPAYLSNELVQKGIENKTLFQGGIRINAHNRKEAYVTTDGMALDVFVDGQGTRNRALEGDIVVVELYLDVEKWKILKDVKEEATEDIPVVRTDDQSEDEGSESEDEGEPSSAENTPVKSKVDELTDRVASTTLQDNELAITLTPEGPMQKGRLMTQEKPFVNKAGQPVQPAGKVVSVVETKHSQHQIGFLETNSGDGQVKSGDRWAIFVPTDVKIPKMMIPINGVPDFYSHPEKYKGKLVYCEMLEWKSTMWRPEGRFIRVMGEAGDIQPETDSLLCVNRITWADQPWSKEILDSIPTNQYEITEEEIRQRRDLRKQRIFTIDPPTARDLDDALHIIPLEDGNFEVGVHIADVSYFVRPGTPVDAEALHRSTTVYLIQKAITMLPNVLCENLCSLNPGVDRLAFSCVWTLSPQGEVLKEWLGRTVIRSCSKMSYNVAQYVIEGKLKENWSEITETATHSQLGPYDGHTVPEMSRDILAMHSIAQHLRKSRYENGSITMNNSKLGFKLDDNGNPIEVYEYVTKEANHMIEEFMLLANMRVALKISSSFPDIALLRNHVNPVERRLSGFAEMCEELQLPMNVTDSKTFSDSLDQLRSTMNRSKFSAIQTLGTRSMQLAKYFCTGDLEREQWHHYALNVEEYTHFTSPIRRYPDIIVHRLLQAALTIEQAEDVKSDQVKQVMNTLPQKIQVTKMATHCNDRKLASRKAQEASSKLFLCVMLKYKPRIAEVVAISIGDRYITCIVPSLNIEIKLYTEDLPLRSHKYDSEAKSITLVWAAPGATKESIKNEGKKEKKKKEKKEKENDTKREEAQEVVPILPAVEEKGGLWKEGHVTQISTLDVLSVMVAIKKDKFPMDFEVTYRPAYSFK
ncbi:mitotic control protein [Planoprotostelium fungivorum]|uniref:DIS3-like exonuclease 2 n=1 Tax=Planoprotostelium fungivorum TaxID=1890364 RepID=A0A2P6NWM5_9EUKA|nr:mitotic control protein [Planoprotostelium fungivorum]